MKKRQAEALAASKPVFLTKKQREELALKKRQDEVAARQGLPRAGGGGALSGAAANGVSEAPRRTEREAQDRRRDDDKRQRDEVVDPAFPPIASKESIRYSLTLSLSLMSCFHAFVCGDHTALPRINLSTYLSA
jgi:hypothetical protein